ncbi:MAG: hypothetical protein K2F59_06165 [Eubacteriales bacterium]|nr:hypothetical protein [Eubacteriales bacterium]
MKRNKILAVGLSAVLGTQAFVANAKAMEDNEIIQENTDERLLSNTLDL